MLAEVLAVTSDWSEVGEAFERARPARVDHVQTFTDKMSRLAGLAGPGCATWEPRSWVHEPFERPTARFGSTHSRSGRA